MSYLQNGKLALIAHRGGTLGFSSGLLPENTLFAFEQTLKIYPHFIFELDVHQTKDGEIIVMHDDRVDRTTNGHGAIRDMSWLEISKLDAGYQTSFKNKKVSRLSEILEAFPESRISIEFKNSGYEEKVGEIVKKAGAENRVVLASFSDEIIDTAAHKTSGHICRGYGQKTISRMLVAAHLHSKFLAPRTGDVFQIPLRAKNIAVYSKKFLKLAHGISKHVHVWTINDEPTMELLIRDGIDGIVTDNPQALFNVAKKLNKIT